MQWVDVLQNIGLFIGYEDKVKLVLETVLDVNLVLWTFGWTHKKLIDIANILRLYGSVLSACISEFREWCEETFDTRARHPIIPDQLHHLRNLFKLQDSLTRGIGAKARACPLGCRLKLRAQPMKHGRPVRITFKAGLETRQELYHRKIFKVLKGWKNWDIVVDLVGRGIFDIEKQRWCFGGGSKV